MIKNLLKSILLFIVIFVLSAFALINIKDFSSTALDTETSFQISFNINRIFAPEMKQGLYICLVVSIMFVTVYLLSKINSTVKKNKYQNINYTRLLTKHERKRGTVRIQYKDDGKITRNTLECYYDTLMKPITRLQNKICSSLLLPKTKYWNTVIDNKLANGKIIHHTSGIPVVAYRKYFLFGKFNRVNYINDIIHVAVIGASGRGKSETFVKSAINTNIDAEESMFVHDPKRELLNTFEAKLRKNNYKVIILDFTKPEYSDAWNPLQYPTESWMENMSKKERGEKYNLSESIEMILDICKTITFEEDSKNPFWHEGAGQMLAGLILYLLESGEYEKVNFSSVKLLMQIGEREKVKKETLLQFIFNACRDIDAESLTKMNTYFTAEGMTRSSLKAVFENKIQMLTATPDIVKMTSNSTFKMSELFEQKTAIFLVSHDEKSTYYQLITIFIKQLYEAIVKWTRKNDVQRLKIPFNFYIDEMALLPEIKDIEAMYGASRSRGVRIFAFFQSIAQLKDKYEPEVTKVILDNCSHLVYLGSMHKESADEMVNLAGKELYYDTREKKYKERDVLTVDQLRQFEKGRILVHALEWKPYIAKLPPYSKCTFAQKEQFISPKVNKTTPLIYDIRDDYQKLLEKSKELKDSKSSIGFVDLVSQTNEQVPVVPRPTIRSNEELFEEMFVVYDN